MCYGSGSWCLSTWKVSLVMLRAVETFWEIFRICKTPGFLQHSWRLSIGDSQVALVQLWIGAQEVAQVYGVQPHHLLICDALGLDHAWYDAPSVQKTDQFSQTP